VIVVDAPCSGSGLFRREPEAMDEWSLNNVQLCSQRQQRILADVWPALKREGILIYSTCSYSKEEDEDILDWISCQLPTVNYQLSIKSEWGIVETTSAAGNKGYRFWPDKVKGEGFFIACFKKEEGGEGASTKIKKKPEKLTKGETTIIEKWIDVTDHDFIKNQSTVYAWRPVLANDFAQLLNNLRVVYSGTIIGEILRDKLVPDHALAMSSIINKNILSVPLDYAQAINYLKRKEIQLPAKDKGWYVVDYMGHPLGWINVLINRINNYYPRELRILKDL
jgi:NOL1/NOP2/fmu family ribosome biogenesis protein